MTLHDPTDLQAASDEADAREKAEQIRRHYEVTDLKWFMAHKQGRRFVWRLFERYGVYRSSFNSDALVMAYLEGQRNNGLALLADCMLHCPERYAEMLKEHSDGGSSNSNTGSTGSTGTERRSAERQHAGNE